MSGKARSTRQDETDAVTVAEVARFTGKPIRELLDLVRAGVLEQVSGRQKASLTTQSLRAWMASGAA